MLLLLTKTIPPDFFGGMLYIIEKYSSMFFNGFINTLILALLGTIFGLLIGLVISLIRNQEVSNRDSFIKRSLKRFGRGASIIYIQYLRGTPMLVQATIVHLGLGRMGLEMNSLLLGIAIISVNTSAYMAEILRASIQAIDPGQMEAARAIGMTETQGMRYFILPQALRNAIPAFGNEFVVNAKDSSVLNVISVAELYYQAIIIGGISYRPIEPLIVISLIYLTITLISSKILSIVEKKLDAPKGTYPSSTTHAHHHLKTKKAGA